MGIFVALTRCHRVGRAGKSHAATRLVAAATTALLLVPILSGTASASTRPPAPNTAVSFDQVVLSWTAGSDASSYTVFRIHVGVDRRAQRVATTTSPTWTDTSVQEGEDYKYTYKMHYNGGSGSRRSKRASVSIPVQPPQETPKFEPPQDQPEPPLQTLQQVSETVLYAADIVSGTSRYAGFVGYSNDPHHPDQSFGTMTPHAGHGTTFEHGGYAYDLRGLYLWDLRPGSEKLLCLYLGVNGDYPQNWVVQVREIAPAGTPADQVRFNVDNWEENWGALDSENYCWYVDVQDPEIDMWREDGSASVSIILPS